VSPNFEIYKLPDFDSSDREIILNAISLAAGFIGNFALMVNFTRRIRYIIALPFTIVSWYIATGIVSGLLDEILMSTDKIVVDRYCGCHE
jgi:hypothetical protein